MKKYIHLICILLIPLLLIFAYSFNEQNFVIELKRADMASCFQTQDNKIDSATSSMPTDTSTMDTTKQRILFFGDSMLEGLSKRLRKYAAANGHDLFNVIWYSSSSKVWAEHIDTISYLLRCFKPTYIFICLGSNELFIKDLDKRNEYIKTILSRIDTIPYIWIGPPNWKDDTGINDVILQNVGKSRFYPSKYLTFERGSDGAHPTLASASKWMDSVAVFIQERALHRIVMHYPEPDIKDVGETILWKPLR